MRLPLCRGGASNALLAELEATPPGVIQIDEAKDEVHASSAEMEAESGPARAV